MPDRKIALVTSKNLHKLSVYSYVDSNNLELLSSVADSTLMLNAWGVSYDNTRDMALVNARNGNSLTTIDLSDTSSMAILGSVSSSTYLDGTLNSCLDEANAIAYTHGLTRTPSLRYRILIEPTPLYSGASVEIPRT